MELENVASAERKENIYNIPNFLTLCRTLISVSLIYLIFADFSIKTVIIVFVVGMITDALDGQIARRFKMTTEFGRKFDVLADRLLIACFVLPLAVKFMGEGFFSKANFIEFFLLLPREIIGIPFAIYGALRKKAFPPVRFLGKLTTVLQAIAFPMILFNAYYGILGDVTLGIAIATFVSGLGAVYYYIGDVLKGKGEQINNRIRKII